MTSKPSQAPFFASRITGTGSAFPAGKLTNHDLAKRIETTHEWIVERTGIHERRVSEPGNPEEFNSSLACAASLRALEMAGKTPEDIDQIVYATCTPDTLIPSTACWLQKKLGAKKAWAMDLNAACSGFVYGVTTADQFIRTGQSKTTLVVGADVYLHLPIGKIALPVSFSEMALERLLLNARHPNLKAKFCPAIFNPMANFGIFFISSQGAPIWK